MKIGVIIPSTSRNRNWGSYKDSYLYNNTLKTYALTYDPEHMHIFYVGIDRGDRIYDTVETKEGLETFASVMKNIKLVFVYMDGIEKGHLTNMWNKLFAQAYEDGCEYFFQCGDDIDFKTKGWINESIEILKKSDGVGVCGPINNNARILTQSFVSRKHMDIFGYYFPPEIINWFCDDWINRIYIKMNKFYPLRGHICINMGGNPRYNINNSSTSITKSEFLKLSRHCDRLVERDLKKYIH